MLELWNYHQQQLCCRYVLEVEGLVRAVEEVGGVEEDLRKAEGTEERHNGRMCPRQCLCPGNSWRLLSHSDYQQLSPMDPNSPPHTSCILQ
mmetsp:Transcript_35621/g.80898  ORF Transcript_35621/g.80898 Transcript_35621/m.80898 type:complete len:91 (+) Transcript_35621:982-1254(+)